MKGKNTILWLALAGIVVYALFESNTATAATSENNVSDALVQQVEGLEQFSATAYPDGSSGNTQLYSIGYGHQIQPSETWLMNATLTQPQAQQILLTDLENIGDILNASGISFTPGQFSALVDFGFSSGAGALNNALQAYNSNGSDGLINYLQGYVYWHPVPGGPAQLNQNLVNRRNMEIQLWNS